MSYTFPRHTYILPHREGVCQVVFLPRAASTAAICSSSAALSITTSKAPCSALRRPASPPTALALQALRRRRVHRRMRRWSAETHLAST